MIVVIEQGFHARVSVNVVRYGAKPMVLDLASLPPIVLRSVSVCNI